MARYKVIDTHPRLLPVNLAAQLLPGSIEHAVDHLLEHVLDLTHFDARFTTTPTGPRPIRRACSSRWSSVPTRAAS